MVIVDKNKKYSLEELKDNFLLGDRVEALNIIPERNVDLIFTSPPYNVGKDYTNNKDNKPYEEYLEFLKDTWRGCYRVLKRGGRLVINVPTTISKSSKLEPEKGMTYIHLYSDIIKQILSLNEETFINDAGEEEKYDIFINTEILWHKQNVKRRTAWGSFQSPSSPYCVHPYEMIIVFSKEQRKLYGEKEFIDITKEEFIDCSLALWNVTPETSKRWHPAPFPRTLANRILKYFSFSNSLVLDPFSGTGTVAEVAKLTGRNFIYIDNSQEYLEKAVDAVNNPVEPKIKKESKTIKE